MKWAGYILIICFGCAAERYDFLNYLDDDYQEYTLSAVMTGLRNYDNQFIEGEMNYTTQEVKKIEIKKEITTDDNLQVRYRLSDYSSNVLSNGTTNLCASDDGKEAGSVIKILLTVLNTKEGGCPLSKQTTEPLSTTHGLVLKASFTTYEFKLAGGFEFWHDGEIIFYVGVGFYMSN